MTLRQIQLFGLGAGLGLIVWGCGPPQVAPVAPPGVELTRVTVGPEEDPAEAVGEAATLGEPLKSAPAVQSGDAESPPTAKGETKTKPSGLIYETLKEGVGTPVKAGQRVSVHYTGTLNSGEVFDSSHNRNQPLTFTVGRGEVIRGWDEGIQGMKPGERRKLTIPSDLGYGSRGQGKIPPDSTLTFVVDLLKVE